MQEWRVTTSAVGHSCTLDADAMQLNSDMSDCGDSIVKGAKQAQNTSCAAPCLGNTTEACGGKKGYIDIFWDVPTVVESVNISGGQWTSLGCFKFAFHYAASCVSF